MAQKQTFLNTGPTNAATKASVIIRNNSLPILKLILLQLQMTGYDNQQDTAIAAMFANSHNVTSINVAGLRITFDGMTVAQINNVFALWHF